MTVGVALGHVGEGQPAGAVLLAVVVAARREEEPEERKDQGWIPEAHARSLSKYTSAVGELSRGLRTRPARPEFSPHLAAENAKESRELT